MGWGNEGDAPHPTIFFEPSPSSKVMAPMVHTSHLKMKRPLPQSEKQAPLPSLKREAPFHEMIPRKSTIINNLKSS